ncbi:MAG TPA: hypothetical protein VN740_04625 [Solirubrobacteraceae bacterium]|nr:hypothetical protein [Solirubrobacteraceae bacterium]
MTSDGVLCDALYARGALAGASSGRTWLQAMLDLAASFAIAEEVISEPAQ